MFEWSVVILILFGLFFFVKAITTLLRLRDEENKIYQDEIKRKGLLWKY